VCHALRVDDLKVPAGEGLRVAGEINRRPASSRSSSPAATLVACWRTVSRAEVHTWCRASRSRGTPSVTTATNVMVKVLSSKRRSSVLAAEAEPGPSYRGDQVGAELAPQPGHVLVQGPPTADQLVFHTSRSSVARVTT